MSERDHREMENLEMPAHVGRMSGLRRIRRGLRGPILGAILMMTLSAREAQTSRDGIAAGFKEPPMRARMRMHWRVFGPAWSHDEIAYEFDRLKEAGVGGVMTCFTYPVALDDPVRGIKNQTFLSPEFLETLRAAAELARERGLRFGVVGGTGWPYGGPGVSIHDAAQHLRRESLRPLPSGSGFALPKLREGERIVALFSGSRQLTVPAADKSVDAQGPCTAFVSGPTGMRVKRPSLGAEGLVVDHFSREAAGRYLDSVVGPMRRAVPNGLLQSVFCDSLEVYNANWTHDFPAQFRKRRGYDLIPRLPELFDDASPASPDLRFDFWRTAAELAEEEFARTVHAWCKSHGLAFELEAYGTPSMGFTAARYCDVPWGEQYEWKGFSFSRFAASGAHLTGKKIVGAEAWTWTGVPNRLADTLSDLKLCSDLHFLAGENEMVGVDYPYSPRSEGAPGWMPYFGPVFNENNPQWMCFQRLAGYVNRCQWLLRQGKPVADVALYVPTEDSFARGPINQMALDFQLRDRLTTGPLTQEFGLKRALEHRSDVVYGILQSGYNFDGIDFFAMDALAKVNGGRIVAGDGDYGIVVLPNLEGIDLRAMEKLARFCRSGGTLIATRRLPTRVYGVRVHDATGELKLLIADVFGQSGIDNGARSARTGAAANDPHPASGVSVRTYGAGKAIFCPDEREALMAATARATTGPDARIAPEQPEVSHVHRRVGNRDFYFLANVGEKEVRFTADFRVSGKAPSLWNPMNGDIAPLSVLGTADGRTQVALTLPARGSLFVCFTPGVPRTGAPAPPPEEQSIPLDPRWRVDFHGPDAPPPVDTETLASWTTWPGAKYFSGTASYAGSFECPEFAGKRVFLRFSEIREAAEIEVNGRAVGALWTPPYEIDVTRCLHAGVNTLRITVANLPVNRVLGLPDPDLNALRAVYGERFPAPEEKSLMSEPAPSGLIGPLTLVIVGNR